MAKPRRKASSRTSSRARPPSKKGRSSRKPSKRTRSDADRHARHRGRSLVQMQVQYRVMETYLVDSAEDISPGGIFIRSKKPLAPGTKVEILFGDPNSEKRVWAEGRVIWSSTKKIRGKRAPGMGIEFTRVDVEGQRFIDNIIHDFLRNVSVL